jgi:hypothetical protein
MFFRTTCILSICCINVLGHPVFYLDTVLMFLGHPVFYLDTVLMFLEHPVFYVDTVLMF